MTFKIIVRGDIKFKKSYRTYIINLRLNNTRLRSWLNIVRRPLRRWIGFGLPTLARIQMSPFNHNKYYLHDN